MSIRILLAGCHVAIWEGMRRFLQSQEDLEIVGQARDGRTAVELTRRLVPDIVLMDIEIPTLDSVDALREIHREQGGVTVIFLSSHPSACYARQTLKAGASGCLPEDCDYQELLAASLRFGPAHGAQPIFRSRLLRVLVMPMVPRADKRNGSIVLCTRRGRL